MVESSRNPAELLQQQWVAHRGEAHIIPRLTAQGNGHTVCGELSWGRRLSTMRGKGLQDTVLCWECLAVAAPRLLQLFAPPICVSSLAGSAAVAGLDVADPGAASLFE
jgi:hypothetical protein